ncbi:uncharacterized protein CBL_08140 [Carabus blaptoides fortunei]
MEGFLNENAGILSYYTSKEKMMRGVRRGCVRLKGAVIGIDDEDDSTFTITVDHKTFHFQARDAAEREKWVRALEDTILRHANRLSWDTNRPPPTIRDFDNKVSEADAYLQIMIDQTKNLEQRIQTLTDAEEKAKCEVILNHANAMLDNIKHSINTAHPVNGIYQASSGQSINLSTSSNTVATPSVSAEGIVQPGIEVGSECLENRQAAIISATASMTLVVPETSYSSSEGEDDFFDANDSPFTSTTQTPTALRQFSIDDTAATAPPVARQPIVKRQDSSTSAINTEDESLDYDALYEDDEEMDMGSMENHGSVISHLLSQVKIGMDLTKVVLPTFILERRSLLEMYADYFAHPDIFVKIADLKDPKERMIQVVRWYLSSYHAGRKSSVARKPYNPVLGEVFRCHWDIPGTEDISNECVDDGPVPWCHQDQLTFVAEQVSHHPPISAFYAEHYNKKICFNAHVYTKSKFLGLSVCVYNIGQGVVSVLDYNEEYIVTFPNGYGRSILTVPWIELGGSVTITCQKTGYHCNIEFITKPFYGNKKHRVTADIYGPMDKKPFLSINGEWNGIMEARWFEKEPEPFIDVHKLNIVTKNVKPIVEQEETESRRLWKEVTAGLKFNNIDKATNAKAYVEQRQRDEAKYRKENNIRWETKMFKQAGENWLYTRPLLHRLTLLQAAKARQVD